MWVNFKVKNIISHGMKKAAIQMVPSIVSKATMKTATGTIKDLTAELVQKEMTFKDRETNKQFITA